MLTYTDFVGISLFGATALTTGFFAYLYKTKRQPYLLAWTGGWAFLLLHHVSIAMESRFGALAWLLILNLWFLAAAALAFFCSARMHSQARPWTPQLLGGAMLFAVWSSAYVLGNTLRVGPQVGVALVFAATAWHFWQQGRRQETYGTRLMSFVFLLWALVQVMQMYFAPIGSGARLETSVLAGVPGLLAAVMMTVAVFEEEKQHIEQNVLALSNLNLATLSFLGSEIEKTLGQVLERVLSVVRLPAGAIFLRHE